MALRSPWSLGMPLDAAVRVTPSMRDSPQCPPPMPARPARCVIPRRSGRYPRSFAAPAPQPLIAQTTLAAWPLHPGIEATSQDTEHLAHSDSPARFLGVSQQRRTSHRLLGKEGRGFFQDVALHCELGDFLAKPLYLGLLWLHHALAGKRLLRVCRQLAHPCPQPRLVHI